MHSLISRFTVKHKLQRFSLQKFGDARAETVQKNVHFVLCRSNFICFEYAVFVVKIFLRNKSLGLLHLVFIIVPQHPMQHLVLVSIFRTVR